MARLSRRESQAATRKNLLASAKEIFLRDGYARASLDEIAERANYSKGAIYSNFAGKEEIFLELLRQKLDDDIAAIRELMAQSRDASALMAGMRGYMKARDDILDFTVVAVEFIGQAGRSKSAAQACAALYRKQRAALSELVALFQKRAAHASGNPDDIAAGIVSLALGLAAQRGMDRKAITQGVWAHVLETYLTAMLEA